MGSIKKVAFAGASGNLGAAILKELLESKLFDITVLTRQSSSHSFSPDVKVVKVDYADLESLTAALSGQDALVSAVATLAIPSQKTSHRRCREGRSEASHPFRIRV